MKPQVVKTYITAFRAADHWTHGGKIAEGKKKNAANKCKTKLITFVLVLLDISGEMENSNVEKFLFFWLFTSFVLPLS